MAGQKYPRAPLKGEQEQLLVCVKLECRVETFTNGFIGTCPACQEVGVSHWKATHS